MTLEDRVASLEKQIEKIQNRLGQFLINSQVSNQPETSCSHANTEDYLSFNNFESKDNVKEIYTFCLDCKIKIE